MKTLFIVRHAKSDWSDETLGDHDRPLNARGRREAPAMGRRLAERAVAPDLIVSSTALRARTTADALAEAIAPQGAASVQLDASLYATTATHLLETVASFGDAVRAAMLVGHNPEISELVRRLTREAVQLSTCAVAECRIDVEHWAELNDPQNESRAVLVRLGTLKR